MYTAFSLAWDTSGLKDMGDVPCNSALAFTSTLTGSVVGGSTQAVLIADGVHIPTFDGQPHPNWVNVAGVYHAVSLVRVGNSTHWTVASNAPGQGTALRRLTTVAIPASFPVAPAIAGLAYVGIPLTVLNVATGSPAPTMTYQWNSAGTAISGATSATYQPQTSDVGNVLTCTVTGSNGTTVSATTAATAAIALHPADYLTFAVGTVNGSTAQAIGTSGGWQVEPVNGYNGYYFPTSAVSATWTFALASPSVALAAAPQTDQYFDTIWPGNANCYVSPGLHTDKTTLTGLNAPLPAPAYYAFDQVGTNYAFNFNGVTVVANVLPVAGDVMRWTRTTASPFNAGDTLHFEVARASDPAAFTVLGWVGVASQGILYPRIAVAYAVLTTQYAVVVKCQGVAT